MSYTIERGEKLILTKVTQEGRKAIATGKFNYSYYSLGDSEVNYNFPEPTRLLKVKDNHPKQVSFLHMQEENNKFISINSLNSDTVKLTLSDTASDRGFFLNPFVNDVRLNEQLTKHSGSFTLEKLDATKELDLTGSVDNDAFNDINDGDIIIMKIPVLSSGETQDANYFSDAIPTLFFSLQKIGATPVFQVDRFLPYYVNQENSDTLEVKYWIIPNSQDAISYYSPSGQTIAWNNDTLEFYEQCSSGDTLVWNLNIPYCDEVIGTTGCTTDVNNYGSQQYASTLQYLNLCKDCLELSSNACSDNLESSDYYGSAAAIIHFSNFNTTNEYGEFFHINESNRLYLPMPMIMWHNRTFSGSTTGNVMGMRFVSDITKKWLYPESDNIEYYDLIEDEQYLAENATPLAVGKVFPNLKIIVIEHPELINVLSYKSNRNYSLPKLTAKQISPVNGVNTGILPRGKRIYMTYTLESGEGIRDIIPQGVISYLDNVGNIDRDVEFKLEDTAKLPYMRHLEDGNYDGLGFFAHSFKVLYQITDSDQLPDPAAWNVVDFSNNIIKGGSSINSINPLILENQIGRDNNFILTSGRVDLHGEGIYSNEFACLCEQSSLTMGDETIFLGNVQTKIGATVYKKVFNVVINELEVVKTDNASYNDGEKYISEISFYNNEYTQIAVSKLSRPVKLRNGSITEFEINFDF